MRKLTPPTDTPRETTKNPNRRRPGRDVTPFAPRTSDVPTIPLTTFRRYGLRNLFSLSRVFASDWSGDANETVFLKALATDERCFGLWSPGIVPMLRLVASYYSARRRDDDAKLHLTRALAILETHGDTSGPIIGRILTQLAALYDRFDERRAVIAIRFRLLEIAWLSESMSDSSDSKFAQRLTELRDCLHAYGLPAQRASQLEFAALQAEHPLPPLCHDLGTF